MSLQKLSVYLSKMKTLIINFKEKQIKLKKKNPNIMHFIDLFAELIFLIAH